MLACGRTESHTPRRRPPRFDTRARRDTGNIPAAANAQRAPPSPRGDDGGPLTAMRLAAPSLVATTSDSSDHGPKEAPLRDSPLSKAAAADRERHLNPKGTKEDPASGYVPEIPAPPSVNRCSGHRCVRHRSAPWVRDAAPACCAVAGDAGDAGAPRAPRRHSEEARAGAASWQGPPSPIETLHDERHSESCLSARPSAGARSPKPPGDAGDGAAEPRAGRLGGRVGRALTRATREGQEEAVFRSKATDEREAFSHLAGGRYMCARLDKRCWLEVEDEKHRYAKNLRRYHYEWIRLGEPCGTFWRWLDGPRPDGSKVCLPTCARERLEAERVRYCAPGAAEKYALRCAHQRVFHLATEEHAELAHHHRRDDDDANRDRRRREPSADRSRRGPPGQPRESPPKPAATGGAPGGDRQPRSFDAPRAATDGEAAAPEGYAPLNTGPKGWIFVLHDGAFYARKKGTSSGKQRFHHSSFFSGECVDAAGIVVAKDGVVTRLLPHSGHYRPRESHFARLLLYLRTVMGLDLDRLEVDVQRLLRVARPEHTKKMDTPHYWAASDALHFLTRKALAKSSNLLYAIENRGALESLRRRDLSLAVDLAETHRLPSRPVLVRRRGSEDEKAGFLRDGEGLEVRPADAPERPAPRDPTATLTNDECAALAAFAAAAAAGKKPRSDSDVGVEEGAPPEGDGAPEGADRPRTPPPARPAWAGAPPLSRSAPSSATRLGHPAAADRDVAPPRLESPPGSPARASTPRGSPRPRGRGDAAECDAAALVDAFPERDGSLEPPRVAQVAPRRARSAERRDARDVVASTSRAHYRRRGDRALFGIRRRATLEAAGAARADADAPATGDRGRAGAAGRGADGWWDGAEPPLLRGRDTAQEEARNDDGAADSSSDSDSDSDNESSDGFSPEDPQGLLRRFESGSKHSLSDLDEDSANELSTTPPNLGSFGGRAKLKKRVTSKDSLQSNEDAEKPAPRPADDDDLDDVPDAGPVFADDLDDELGRLSLRRARRGSDEDKRRPGSSRV